MITQEVTRFCCQQPVRNIHFDNQYIMLCYGLGNIDDFMNFCRQGCNRWFWGCWPQYHCESNDGWILCWRDWCLYGSGQERIYSSQTTSLQSRQDIRLHYQASAVLGATGNIGTCCCYQVLHQVWVKKVASACMLNGAPISYSELFGLGLCPWCVAPLVPVILFYFVRGIVLLEKLVGFCCIKLPWCERFWLCSSLGCLLCC